MFDLICGTSTGGVLAVLIGIRRLDAKRCDAIYKGKLDPLQSSSLGPL